MNHFVFFVCMELDIQGREKYRSCLCKHKLRNNSSMLSFSKIRVFEEPTGCQGFTLVVNPYENYFNKFSLNIFPDVSRKSVNVKKNNGNFKLFFLVKMPSARAVLFWIFVVTEVKLKIENFLLHYFCIYGNFLGMLKLLKLCFN